jgi:hypothetical protein
MTGQKGGGNRHRLEKNGEQYQMSKYTWPVRATRKFDAVVSSRLFALVGRLDACTSYMPLPLRSVWLRGALKASLTPPKRKKFKKKKAGRKGSGGRKEAQQERGVLSWAGLHKILANSGEDKAGDQKRLQPQRPKTRPELSAKSFNLRRKRRQSRLDGDATPRPAAKRV